MNIEPEHLRIAFGVYTTLLLVIALKTGQANWWKATAKRLEKECADWTEPREFQDLHAAEMARIYKDWADEIGRMTARHKAEVDHLREDWTGEVERMAERYENESVRLHELLKGKESAE